MQFTEEEISQHAFPAVIDAGRKLLVRKAVKRLQIVADDVVASVEGDGLYHVVITRVSQKKLHYACNCGFAYGGACEHAVAVMLSVNERPALQTGLDLGAHRTSASELAPLPAIETRVVSDKPVGRLYLNEHDGRLLIDLRFAYDEGRVEFKRGDFERERLAPLADNTVVRIVRSRGREDEMVARLFESGLVQYQAGIFTPRDDARVWVLEMLPCCANAGFEIYGREQLTAMRTREAPPHLGVRVSAGTGILSCDIALSFNGVAAPLSALIAAARAQSRYVRLSDGSTGVLPEEWLEKLAAILDSCDDTPADGDRLTLRPSQAALAEMLLEFAGPAGNGPGLSGRKQAPAAFTGIREQPLPAGFGADLRPYQRAGYDWLYFLREQGIGGCLADDMGLGKTVMALALLYNEKRQQRNNRTSLVVAPASLLFNWQREALRFAPGLLVMTWHGDGRRRYRADDMSMADIVLTSYGTLLRDGEMFAARRFNWVVLDESQVIKNPLARISRVARSLVADQRLALSGTPIENNLSELWSIFTFLNPGMLGPYRHFCTHFAWPIERERNAAASQVLQRLIRPCMLRRTKPQVASDLPPKTETTLYAELLPRQKMVYDITRDAYRARIAAAMDRDGIERSRLQILEGLLRLRQVCCHPLLMDAAFAGESGKFRLLDACLDDIVAGGHKVLLFSQFVKALQLVRGRLTARGMRTELLTGATVDRAAVVDRFQNDPAIPVFLISLKAGGVGLNLTSADYVVHLDPWWNPAAETQAADRAWRIGQTRPVFVYKMITRGSIEERIAELQESKRELIDWIIRPEATLFKHLTKEDVAGLFR